MATTIIDNTAYPSLNAALQALGNSPTLLTIDAVSYPAAAAPSTVTIPPTFQIRFLGGGTLNVGTGQIVNVASTPDYWPLRQIFTGPGTVQINDPLLPDKPSFLETYPEWWGAKPDGSATINTTAIQAAINFWAPGTPKRGGAVRFAARANYSISNTITWLKGVELRGNQGGTDFNHPTRLVWAGPVNIPMFVVPSDGVANSNTVWTRATSLWFDGGANSGGTAGASQIVAFPAGTNDKIDFGTEFEICMFSACLGNALHYSGGATNLHIHGCRWDGIRGYAIYVNCNNSSFLYSINRITYDTGFSADTIPCAGFLFLDGTSAVANTLSVGSIRDARIEINKSLSGNKAVIYLGVASPALSSVLQHQLLLENMWVPVSSGKTFDGLIKLSSQNPNAVALTAVSLYPYNFQGVEIVANTGLSPTPAKDKTFPLYVFAPFTSGSPSSENSVLSVYSNFQGKRLIMDRGKVLASTDLALSQWGTGATVSVNGNDHRGQFTVTEQTGAGANRTIVLTFKDGTWNTAPVVVVTRNGGSATSQAQLTWTVTPTALTISLAGTTAVVNATWTFTYMVMG